jgi:hypothetical protein
MARIARPKLRTLALVAAPVAAVAITVPTVAMATGGSSSVFKACLQPDGTINSVSVDSADPDCSNGILPDGQVVTWNQQGVQGAQGIQGIPGIAGLPGAQGVQGATGATGPAGKNGVSGYKMVIAATKAAPRTVATYTVHCKDGRYALGGGMTGAPELILNGSGPTGDAKGWTVRATNVATTAKKIKVYVTCAFAS